jgi:UDP-glucose 4-epimerase
LNIGGTEEITIVELAHRVQKASGLPGSPRIEFVPYESFTGNKYEDVRRRVPDTSLSRKILDFEAGVSLDEGLKQTIEWQREVTRQRKFGG